MAASAAASVKAVERASAKDVGFAVGIVFILTVLFLPLPATFIDIGLSFSIALAVLILMVSLWIQRPLDFSAFPTVLLLATLLRLSLDIATTRLILSNGSEGPEAAGHVIAGFANFVMSGDFVIGTIVFVILILVTVVSGGRGYPSPSSHAADCDPRPVASTTRSASSVSCPRPGDRWTVTPLAG